MSTDPVEAGYAAPETKLASVDPTTAIDAGRSRHESDPDDGVVGVASWYGPGLHGRRTANGERYNKYALTAAHPTLPFGTRVVVTNLENGRQVRLRINDRGPFVDGRIIDVSYRAAEVLDLVEVGLGQVRIDVVESR